MELWNVINKWSYSEAAIASPEENVWLSDLCKVNRTKSILTKIFLTSILHFTILIHKYKRKTKIFFKQ